MSRPRISGAALRYCAWVATAVFVMVRFVFGVIDLPWMVEFVVGDIIAYHLPMGAAAVLGLVLALTVPKRGLERSNWVLISTICGIVFVTEAYWAAYAALVDPAGPTHASWVIPALAVAMVLVQLLIVRMTRLGRDTSLRRLRFHLDITVSMVIAFPVVYLYWTLPAVMRYTPLAVAPAAILAVYPVVGVMLMLAGTPITFQLSEFARPVWERVTGAAVLTLGLTLALFPLWYPPALSANRNGPDWFTLLLGLGFDLMLVGMVYRVTDSKDEAWSDPWPLPALVAPGLSHVFHTGTVLALVVLGWTAFVHSGEESATPLKFAAFILVILLALRNWIAALERAAVRTKASVDPSTGAYSRELLDSRVRDLVEYSLEAGHELSVVVFDVRDVRRAGRADRRTSENEAAQALIRAIRNEATSGTEVFRVGGDRFAVIFPGEPETSASAFALRVWLAQNPRTGIGSVSRFGVCAGVATFPVHAVDAQSLLAAAEVALSVARGAEEEPVAIFDETMSSVDEEERTNRERMRELRSTVRALAEAVDARDPATRDHSANVSELATALAQVLGMDDRSIQAVGLAALMHDVGKIGVRDEVLLKPGTLLTSERLEIEEHSVLGERILAPARLDDILPAVRSHHERWDGDGYPDGLRGEDIPLEARILAVCDAFETMTTGRPYRPAMSAKDALAEIGRRSGAQFDPGVASAFARMVRGLSVHSRVPVTTDAT